MKIFVAGTSLEPDYGGPAVSVSRLAAAWPELAPKWRCGRQTVARRPPGSSPCNRRSDLPWRHTRGGAGDLRPGGCYSRQRPLASAQSPHRDAPPPARHPEDRQCPREVLEPSAPAPQARQEGHRLGPLSAPRSAPGGIAARHGELGDRGGSRSRCRLPDRQHSQRCRSAGTVVRAGPGCRAGERAPSPLLEPHPPEKGLAHADRGLGAAPLRGLAAADRGPRRGRTSSGRSRRLSSAIVSPESCPFSARWEGKAKTDAYRTADLFILPTPLASAWWWRRRCPMAFPS